MKKSLLYGKRGEYNTDDSIRQEIAEQTYYLLSSKMKDYFKIELITDPFVWLWTEIPAKGVMKEKYISVPYWSENAIRTLGSGKAEEIKNLCHEHVVPRKFFAEKLVKEFASKKNGQQENIINWIYDFYMKYAVAAVIDKKKDKFIKGCNNDMPENPKTTWDRYELSKIPILKFDAKKNTKPMELDFHEKSFEF